LRSHCRECVNAANSARNKASGQSRRWRELNPEKARAFEANWRRENLAKRAEIENRRRTRKRQGVVEKIDPFAIYERDGGRCHICGKHVPQRKMSLDHLVPVSKGGAHVALNVRIAHRECNSRRGAGHLPAQLLLT
jgi:5-methylcytosine-specific restriction endonuclease McrA